MSEESDLQEFVKHKDGFEQLNKKIEKLSQNQGVQARIPYIINF